MNNIDKDRKINLGTTDKLNYEYLKEVIDRLYDEDLRKEIDNSKENKKEFDVWNIA